MAKDPVCGMEVDPQTAAGKSEYKAQTYYFCSLGCKASFDKEPEKYLSPHHEHDTHHHYGKLGKYQVGSGEIKWKRRKKYKKYNPKNNRPSQ
jgi:YHS domain-containing protein